MTLMPLFNLALPCLAQHSPLTAPVPNQILPTYHAGDVLVSIEAQVNGGIGPQRTASTLIIKT
ncbi:hypothetical protein ACMSI6_26385 [Pseudomonas antarctica]|uniref:hypothetical protein n=1 Tax=Pseudomonas antarctica TaxID=219572 RepID=UPI0039C18DE9